ncbi:hypothetical protein TWF679_006186 [Orbilia oligospora]|uniref:Uncharacterized protein n=1 Tax=Orbilia oligospora TaxID=2813651 RepID=A0A8H8VAR5_ORBOL|nr:hypothetical protein TWF679_006186 [Orbilia oligospora]
MASRWHPSATDPNIYTTPFDPIEKITHYYAATINPHIPQWSITSGAILSSSSGTYTPSQIKSAWKTLRYHHPIIAVTINDDGTGLVYKSPESDEEVERWIEETVVVVVDGGEDDDNIASGFGNEAGRLPPSLFDTLGRKNWRDEKNFGLNDEMVKTAEEIAGKFLGNESIAVSIKDGVGMDTVPEVPYGRVEHEFDEEETERIVKACREIGVTVTNAVMAASAIEMAKYGDIEEGGKREKKKERAISNLVSVNYRPLVEGEGKLQAGGNMFVDTFSVFEVENDNGLKDFKEFAKGVKEELSKWKNNEDYVSYSPLLARRLEEIARKGVEEGDIGHSGFVVSSLGIVENYLKEQVDDFWFGILVASVGAGCLFIWTVKGRLRIAVCFNKAWFGEGVIEGFVDGVWVIRIFYYMFVRDT